MATKVRLEFQRQGRALSTESGVSHTEVAAEAQRMLLYKEERVEKEERWMPNLVSHQDKKV